MKIVLTMNLPYTRSHGGTNRSNRFMLESLAERGHEIHVIGPALAVPSPVTFEQWLENLGKETAYTIDDKGLVYYKMDGVNVVSVKSQKALKDVLIEKMKEYQPDWVFVSSEDPSQNLLEGALETYPERVIYLAHTPQLFPFGRDSLYPGRKRTAMVQKARAAVAISNYVAGLVREGTGLEVLVNQPPHYGKPPFPDFGCFEKGYILSMNASTVKGFPLIYKLAEKFPELQFATLRGYATTSRELKMIEELPNFTLLQNRVDLNDILCETRLFLMPSLWTEGFGMAAIDVMLRGIPVLASNFGGLIEAMLDTDYVLPVTPIREYLNEFDENMLPLPVVPPQNTGPWEEAIRTLTTNREEYEKQSRAAREKSLAFINSLKISPLEDFLEDLKGKTKVSGTVAAGAKTSGTAGKGDKNARAALAMKLLKKRKQEGGAPRKKETTISVLQNKESIPLSFAQQRLWFIDSFEKGTSSYNMHLPVRLKMALDPVIFGKALDLLSRRHQILRTNFLLEGEDPVQIIRPEVQIPVKHLLLKDNEDVETAARRCSAEESNHLFDLAKDLLIRVTLLQSGEADFVLLLTIHHIICDGLSMDIIVKELMAAYQALLEGGKPDLPALPIQYADYSAWQKNQLEGENINKLKSFWRENLGDAPFYLNLPLDRPRPGVQTFEGKSVDFTMPGEILPGLEKISKETNTTMFMVMQSIFGILLSRYSNQRDLLMGTAIANRKYKELEPLIGLFVNILVLRIKFDEEATFSDLLEFVRKNTLDCFNHQELPFEKLVEILGVERDLRISPVFQVAFNWEGENRETSGPDEAEMDILETGGVSANYDLTLSMGIDENGLFGNLIYNTGLFNPETITRFLAHFRHLAEEVAARPGGLIGEYDMVPSWEKAEIIERCKASEKPYNKDLCIHQVFEQHAGENPGRTALLCGDKELSYGDLNVLSNRLAHWLTARGYKKGDPVGICSDRDFNFVAGILGTWKLGGVYTPLAPDYPASRLDFMVRDAGVKCVLSSSKYASLFSSSGVPVYFFEDIMMESGSCETVNPSPGMRQEDPCYIIYTSGSTGTPKGVLLEHKGLLNVSQNHRDLLRIGPGDRILQFASMGFDSSVAECVMALGTGAALVLIGSRSLLPGPEFVDFLREYKVTFFTLPPSALELLPRDHSPLENLRMITVAGESCPLSLARWWSQKYSFVNLYGPTEATIWATWKECSPEDEVMTIGRPINNTGIFILDSKGQMVPRGVAGELYIETRGLAREYLNRGDLTERHFITNPHTGGKAYRTGDLGRYLPDGEIEFLGRVDNQVKLRGYRIELGEIEAVLSGLQGVKQAVVLLTGSGEKAILTAFLGVDQKISAPGVKSALSPLLPGYMVPGKYVFLDTIPLTPNGKIDKNALVQLAEGTGDVLREYTPPRDEYEQKLCGIWSRILDTGRVSVKDDFFSVGGNSLLVVRMGVAITREFACDIPLAEIFQNSTIERLAVLIRGVLKNEGQRPLIVNLSGEEKAKKLFCFHPADGMIYSYNDLARSIHEEFSFYGVRSPGLYSEETPPDCIHEMAEMYIREMMKIQPSGPYYLMGWSLGGLLAYEVAVNLTKSGKNVSFLGVIDSSAENGLQEESEAQGSLLVDYFSEVIEISPDEINDMNEDEQIFYVIEKSRKMEALPPDVDHGQIKRLLEVYKNNVNAAIAYAPSVYEGNMTLFQTKKTPGEAESQIESWKKIVRGNVTVLDIDGDHENLVKPPYVSSLSKKINCLIEV